MIVNREIELFSIWVKRFKYKLCLFVNQKICHYFDVCRHSVISTANKKWRNVNKREKNKSSW